MSPINMLMQEPFFAYQKSLKENHYQILPLYSIIITAYIHCTKTTRILITSYNISFKSRKNIDTHRKNIKPEKDIKSHHFGGVYLHRTSDAFKSTHLNDSICPSYSLTSFKSTTHAILITVCWMTYYMIVTVDMGTPPVNYMRRYRVASSLDDP